MARGSNAGRVARRTRSRKTAKRLAAKKVMLAGKKRAKGRATHH